MKICFLAAANSIHSKKWIQYFAKAGHEVHWISFTPPAEGLIENVEFYQVEGNMFLKIFRSWQLIRRIKPDILHAHYAGLYGFVGALSGVHPYVITAWGSDVLIATKSKIKKYLVRYALDKADLITCDADHMEKAMIDLNVDTSKIKIVYFGIDTEKFCPGDASLSLKNDLKIIDNPIVISLRSFEPVYDIETLIKAMPIVLGKFSKAVFLLGGKGSQEEEIKKLAEELGVTNNIRFLGWVPNDKLPEYFRLSDVYVSTSLSDGGIAASTAEAMSCEVPVVVTDSGENKKWIENGKNGLLIPVKNSARLAEKIVYLLRNEGIRRKISENGRKTIVQKNDYNREMKKMDMIYESMNKKKELPKNNLVRISNGISLAKILAMLWIVSVNYWVFIFAVYFNVQYSYAIEKSRNFVEVLDSNSWFSDKIYFVFAYSGWAGVVAFVFMSGFSLWFSILSSKKFQVGDYILKRFNGIYVSYFISIIVAFLVGVFIQKIEPKEMDFSALIMGVSKLVPSAYEYNPPLWFITAILLMYLFFPIIPLIYSKFRFKGLLLLNAIGIALFVYIGPTYFLKIKGPFYPLIPFFMFLSLGVLFSHIVFKYSQKITNQKRYLRTLSFVVIVILSLYLLRHFLFTIPSLNPNLPWEVINVYSAGTVGAILFFVVGYALPIKCHKVVRMLSRGTFAVFLYHYMLIPFIVPYIKPSLFTSHLSIALPALYLIFLLSGSFVQYLLDNTIINFTKKLTRKEYNIEI